MRVAGGAARSVAPFPVRARAAAPAKALSQVRRFIMVEKITRIGLARESGEFRNRRRDPATPLSQTWERVAAR
jgi:hypothetical protein